MRFTSLPVELIRSRPRLMFWIVVLVQALIWLAVPLLVYGSPPGDVPAALAYGREYQVGIAPGPPLAYWLTDLAYRLAGGHAIGIYLLAQACLIVSYWAVFTLARSLVGPQHAVLVLLLTVTIPFYDFPSLEFGPNVLAQPLWALIVLNLWRVIGLHHRGAWLGLSIASGLLLLTTPAAVGLLVLVVLVMVGSAAGRRALASLDALLATLAALVLAWPYLVWLIRAGHMSSFVSADWLVWPTARALLESWGMFLGVSAIALIGIIALIAIAIAPFGRWPERDTPLIVRAPVVASARRFVLIFAIVPPLAATLISALRGSDTVIGGTGTMLIFSGLAAVLLLPNHIPLRRRHLLRTVWAAVIAIPAVAVIVATLALPWTGRRELSHAMPASDIAAFFGESFERRTAKPLRAVAGDAQLAALVAMGRTRPHLFLDATPDLTPWQTMADFTRTGGIVLWRASDTVGAPPADIAARFPGLTPELPRSFDRLVNGRWPPLRIGWAIVRPAGHSRIGSLWR